MDNTLPLSNTQIRKHIHYQRSQLYPGKKIQLDAQITYRLNCNPVLQRSQHIGGYYAIDGEVTISDWFQGAWKQSKHCYLPIIVDNRLLFAHYRATTDLAPNKWGILEPITDQLISPIQLDALIIPLVAFDRHMNRLGRGGGYYDQTLAFKKQALFPKKPYLIGIGYAFQEVPSIVTHTWDIPMDCIITEQQTLTRLGPPEYTP